MPVLLKKLIDKYVNQIGRNFIFEEALDYIENEVGDTIPHLTERVENLILQSKFLFYDEEKDFYIPRNIFFKNSRFLVSPTGEEIAEGVLIPGHRFLPFCNPYIFPAECILVNEAGAEIAVKKVSRMVKELYIYVSLLDIVTIPDYLIYDDESNNDVFKSEDYEEEKVKLRVYDMAEYYEKHDFQPGDGLILTVKDWEKGIYELQYISKKELGKNKTLIKKWTSIMDDCFGELFAKEGILPTIEEQLARAVQQGGDFLFRNPYINLGGFLGQSRVVAIKYIAGRHILWFRDETPGIEDFITPDEMSGDSDTLEDILRDVRSPLTRIQIEAYMLDELYNRKSNFKNIVNRAFGDFEIIFFDTYQEESFNSFLEILWEKIKKDYNYFTDQKRGRIRQRALKVYDSYNSWMKKLESKNVPVDNVPSEEMFTISGYIEGIQSVLALCNQDRGLSDFEEQRILELLDVTENAIGWISQQIEEKIKPQFTLIKNTGAAHCYTLKITLKGSKPPVWRRVRLPGNINLGQLHFIIQAVFEWTNSHLHEFTIRDLHYGITQEDSWNEIKDENETLLSDLNLKEKEKFLYIYDFGDNWQHNILVERVIPISEIEESERYHFICLAGKRACPPEDCGGIWSYYNLIEVMGDPAHPEHEDLVEWAGGTFDPDLFSLEEVNYNLRDLFSST